MNIKAFCMLALLACSGEAFAELSYYPTWIDDSGIHYTPGNEVVMKDEAAAGWNSGARSSEVLLAADDGWIRYEVESYQSATRAFGFAITDPNYHYTSMAYSFRLANSTCYFQKGSVIVGTMAVTQGDVLEIVKNGTDIEYKVNGVIRVTTTPAQFSDMFLDLAFHTRWGYIGKLEVSFGNDYDSEWEQVIGIAKTATTLTKTAADGWGNAGASSDNVLKPNEAGWVSYTPPNTTGHLAFGFSDLDKDQHYSSIDYCMLVDASGMLKGYSNGSLLFAGSYAAGDVLTITRQDNEYIFTQNSTVLHTANDYGRVPMIADLAIYRNNTVVNQSDFRLSFDQEVYSYVEVTPLGYGTVGTATFRSYGGSQASRFSTGESVMTESTWNANKANLDPEEVQYLDSIGFTAAFLSDVNSIQLNESGEYKLYTRDNSLGSHSASFVMGFKEEIDTIFRMTYSNGLLTKTGASSSSANALWSLDNGFTSGETEGRFTVQPLRGLSANFKVGLHEDGATAQSQGNHLKYGFSVSNGSLKTIKNGSLGSFSGKVFGNEELELQVTLDSVYYYKDNELMEVVALATGTTYRMGAFINDQNGTFLLSRAAMDRPDRPIRARIFVEDIFCDQEFGSIQISLPQMTVGCPMTFSLTDSNGNTVSQGSTNFTNVPAGVYTVSATSSCPELDWSQEVEVSYVLDWDDNTFSGTADENVVQNLDLSIDNVLFNNGVAFNSSAFSTNRLVFGADGWIEFSFDGPVTNQSGGFSLRTTDGDIVANIGYIGPDFWGFGQLLIIFHTRDENGAIVDLEVISSDSNTFRIQRENGQFSIITNTDSFTSSLINESTLIAHGAVPYSASEIELARASFRCFDVPVVYYELLRDFDGSNVQLLDNEVRFEYEEQYYVDVDNTVNLNYAITDWQRNIVMNTTSNPVGKVYGENLVSIDVSSLPAGTYQLEVFNDKRENWVLRFTK
ncbi:MAG: hypothetical protein MK081_14730 [Flavobacteriales bacterium]|nr:hypothetical protein [Flavobacteriales bacterium]